MTIDLDRIESLARDVAPGPWHTGIGGHYDREVRAFDNKSIAWCGAGPEREALVRASYIAALDPDTVRALFRIAKAAVAYQEAAPLSESLAYLRVALRAAGLIPSPGSPNPQIMNNKPKGKSVNINDLTIGEAKQLAAMFAQQPADHSAWEVGACYLIRTVTMIDTGRVVAVTPHEIVLEDAAWIADTGRFSDALVSVDFAEVEPFPTGHIIVGRGSIVDAVKIAALPREQK